MENGIARISFWSALSRYGRNRPSYTLTLLDRVGVYQFQVRLEMADQSLDHFTLGVQQMVFDPEDLGRITRQLSEGLVVPHQFSIVGVEDAQNDVGGTAIPKIVGQTLHNTDLHVWPQNRLTESEAIHAYAAVVFVPELQ